MTSLHTLTFANVTYQLLYVGGFGWSAGCGSIIDALDGPQAGKLFVAHIGNGIHEQPKLIEDTAMLHDALSDIRFRYKLSGKTMPAEEIARLESKI